MSEHPTSDGLIIDLFAGPGGWDVAAQGLGLAPIGIERDRAACATRAAAGHRTIRADLSTYEVPPSTRIDGLIGSPPCTDFSLAGLRRGLEGPTGKLIEIPMQWARRHRPRWIALEQVPPVLPIWLRYADDLAALGYSTWAGILYAEQYGVPQTRRRALLLAHRERAVAPPTPTHSRFRPHAPAALDAGVLPWVSMADALGWGMTARPSVTVVSRTHYEDGRAMGSPRPLDGGSGARATMRRAIDRGEFLFVASGGDAAHVAREGQRPRPTGEPAGTITSKGTAYWWTRRPSTTIVASFRPDIVAAPGYRKAGDGPRQNAAGSVRVTVSEAALLQSFPADYPWSGTTAKQYEQIGNAVPPLLARAVLGALL